MIFMIGVFSMIVGKIKRITCTAYTTYQSYKSCVRPVATYWWSRCQRLAVPVMDRFSGGARNTWRGHHGLGGLSRRPYYVPVYGIAEDHSTNEFCIVIQIQRKFIVTQLLAIISLHSFVHAPCLYLNRWWLIVNWALKTYLSGSWMSCTWGL